MNPTGMAEVTQSIQVAVAPVFLLSGVGVVLTVLTNRLGRIIDRARSLEKALEEPTAPSREDREGELRDLSRRGRMIQLAISLSALCALLICLVIVALFAGAALARDLSRLIMVLFTAGLGAFIAALLVFLLEIRAATSVLRFGPGPHGR